MRWAVRVGSLALIVVVAAAAVLGVTWVLPDGARLGLPSAKPPLLHAQSQCAWVQDQGSLGHCAGACSAGRKCMQTGLKRCGCLPLTPPSVWLPADAKEGLDLRVRANVWAYLVSSETAANPETFGFGSGPPSGQLFDCHTAPNGPVSLGALGPGEVKFWLNGTGTYTDNNPATYRTGGDRLACDRNTPDSQKYICHQSYTFKYSRPDDCVTIAWEDALTKYWSSPEPDFNDCVVKLCASPSSKVGGVVGLPPAAVAAESGAATEGSGWATATWAALAGSAVAIGIGGWYARRRWLR